MMVTIFVAHRHGMAVWEFYIWKSMWSSILVVIKGLDLSITINFRLALCLQNVSMYSNFLFYQKNKAVSRLTVTHLKKNNIKLVV